MNTFNIIGTVYRPEDLGPRHSQPEYLEEMIAKEGWVFVHNQNTGGVFAVRQGHAGALENPVLPDNVELIMVS